MTPKRLRKRVVRYLTYATLVWGALQVLAWRLSSGHEGSATFSRVAVAGSDAFVSVAPALHSGRVQAIAAGIAIDIADAELADEGADLTLRCFAGGIAVSVSSGWKVIGLDDAPSAVATNVTDPAELPDDAPVLRVHLEGPIIGGIAIGV